MVQDLEQVAGCLKTAWFWAEKEGDGFVFPWVNLQRQVNSIMIVCWFRMSEGSIMGYHG